MNNFVKGLLITGAAPVALSILMAVGVKVSGGDEGAILTLGMGWFAAVIVFIICLVIGLVARNLRTKDGRAGVLTGIGLSVVALGVSCFTMTT